GSEAIGNVPDVVGGGTGGVGSSNSTVEKHVPILPVLLWSALFCILFAWLYQRMISQKHPLDQRSNSYSGWMGVALVIGLLLRIWMGLTVRGFETDMNTFMSWAHHANEQGLVGFYSEG